MSAESESFLARWSRRKRAAEREAERPTEGDAPAVAAAPPTKLGGEGVGEDGSASAIAPRHDPAATTDVPLPPIESLDGLRSDYQAFFQQPVDDEMRRAALKKLFADPHFNQMDMLDVYVDDYTQFEPLPAALRLRLPSARAFLLDFEREALEAAEAAADATGDAPTKASVAAAGQDSNPVADNASVQSNSALTTTPNSDTNATSTSDTAQVIDTSSSPAIPPGKAAAPDPSST